MVCGFMINMERDRLRHLMITKMKEKELLFEDIFLYGICGVDKDGKRVHPIELEKILYNHEKKR